MPDLYFESNHLIHSVYNNNNNNIYINHLILFALHCLSLLCVRKKIINHCFDIIVVFFLYKKY